MPNSSAVEKDPAGRGNPVDGKNVDGKEKTAADPSPADGKGEKTTAEVLDEVLAASKPGAEQAPDSETGQEGPDGTDKAAIDDKSKGAEEELPDEVTEDELKAQKPKTQKRIRKLLAQRDEYREIGTPEEVKQFKHSHEQFTRITAYIEEAGLVSEEVSTGFEIMRLMKQEPLKAREALRPYMARLEQIAGEVLAPELAERVKQGAIAEEDARQLQRSQSREALAQAAAKRAADKAESIQQQTQTRTNTLEVQQSVSLWEQKWRAADPDYKAKQPRVQKEIKLAVLELGHVPSAKEAVAIAQKAIDEVNAEFKALRPSKKDAIDPPVSGGAAPDAQPVPKTTLDVVNQALRASAAR